MHSFSYNTMEDKRCAYTIDYPFAVGAIVAVSTVCNRTATPGAGIHINIFGGSQAGITEKFPFFTAPDAPPGEK